MKIIDGITIFGEVEPGALSQIKTCAKTAYKCALMGDNHKGYSMPIGGVVAYKDQISPSGVGYDIACGNKAVLTDADPQDIRKNISRIMDDVWNTISFGVGQKNKQIVEHPIFDRDHPGWGVLTNIVDKRFAQSQLGTVGSGNHYVDIFIDDSNRVWIGCHFGSRGLGHKAATHFLKLAGGKDGMDVDPTIIDVNTSLGQDYLEAMKLAGEYAYAGRDWVCDRVVSGILGANIIDSVHNHHNFAWKEYHFGEELWVVRKGATPAFPGQRGFVGGSMGDISVIIEGRRKDWHNETSIEKELQEQSMYSTVHGAGRVMGRMEAKGKRDKVTGEWKREPKVTEEEMQKWIIEKGVELRGAGVDESPQVYKRLPEVLKAHEGTINILHTLTPIGVAMAGKHEFDPWKD